MSHSRFGYMGYAIMTPDGMRPATKADYEAMLEQKEKDRARYVADLRFLYECDQRRRTAVPDAILRGMWEGLALCLLIVAGIGLWEWLR